QASPPTGAALPQSERFDVRLRGHPPVPEDVGPRIRRHHVDLQRTARRPPNSATNSQHRSTSRKFKTIPFLGYRHPSSDIFLEPRRRLTSVRKPSIGPARPRIDLLDLRAADKISREVRGREQHRLAVEDVP